MTRRLSAAQALVVRMRAGDRLWWFGDSGPEIDGRSFWPQKRTVRVLLRSGVLAWAPPANETQRRCGIRELLVVDEP